MIFLDPKSDIAFKKLFSNAAHTEILISFLNSVLERSEGEKIVNVVINSPHNLPEVSGAKLSIVDVKCTDQRNVNYIVEMQVVKEQDYAQRCQYYSALALSRQLQKKEKYKQLTPVIFVGVLDFELLDSPNYLSHHLILDTKTHEHRLRHLEFHFIELGKFDKKEENITSDLEKWMYLLKYADSLKQIPSILKQTPAMQQALDILEQGSWSLEELESYDYYIKSLRSQQSQVDTAYEDGKEDGRKAVAKNLLLQYKMPIQDVVMVTGLSVEEIEALKTQE